MQSQFIAAINQLCDEKNITRDTVLETVKSALKAAFRKDFGNKDQNVDVDLDENSGSDADASEMEIDDDDLDDLQNLPWPIQPQPNNPF